jgi:hypothetical protein
MRQRHLFSRHGHLCSHPPFCMFLSYIFLSTHCFCLYFPFNLFLDAVLSSTVSSSACSCYYSTFFCSIVFFFALSPNPLIIVSMRFYASAIVGSSRQLRFCCSLTDASKFSRRDNKLRCI